MIGHMVLQHLCIGFVIIIVSNKGITTCLPHIKLIEYNTPSLADFGLTSYPPFPPPHIPDCLGIIPEVILSFQVALLG